MTNRTFSILALTLVFLAGSAFSYPPQEEYGKAGWYADALHGRKTSSGEKYDKNAFTCSHKTLPYGTIVRVTRLDDKRAVDVRVNDRGHFKEGFIVDLSRRAAEEIGLVQDGSVRVKLEVVEKPEDREQKQKEAAAAAVAAERADILRGSAPATYSNTAKIAAKGTSSTALKTTQATAATVQPLKAKAVTVKGAAATTTSMVTDLYQIDLAKPARKGFGVQVATLYSAANVLPEVNKLQGKWPGKVMVSVQPMPEDAEQSIYKLLLGPFTDRAAADKMLRDTPKKGYKKCFVVDLSTL